jgi:hypothetical protein
MASLSGFLRLHENHIYWVTEKENSSKSTIMKSYARIFQPQDTM